MLKSKTKKIHQISRKVKNTKRDKSNNRVKHTKKLHGGCALVKVKS